MHTQQRGIPSEKTHQMMASLILLSGTAYRRRRPNNDREVSLLDHFVNFVKLMRCLAEPHNTWQQSGYRHYVP